MRAWIVVLLLLPASAGCLDMMDPDSYLQDWRPSLELCAEDRSTCLTQNTVAEVQASAPATSICSSMDDADEPLLLRHFDPATQQPGIEARSIGMPFSVFQLDGDKIFLLAHFPAEGGYIALDMGVEAFETARFGIAAAQVAQDSISLRGAPVFIEPVMRGGANELSNLRFLVDHDTGLWDIDMATITLLYPDAVYTSGIGNGMIETTILLDQGAVSIERYAWGFNSPIRQWFCDTPPAQADDGGATPLLA